MASNSHVLKHLDKILYSWQRGGLVENKGLNWKFEHSFDVSDENGVLAHRTGITEVTVINIDS